MSAFFCTGACFWCKFRTSNLPTRHANLEPSNSPREPGPERLGGAPVPGARERGPRADPAPCGLPPLAPRRAPKNNAVQGDCPQLVSLFYGDRPRPGNSPFKGTVPNSYRCSTGTVPDLDRVRATSLGEDVRGGEAAQSAVIPNRRQSGAVRQDDAAYVSRNVRRFNARPRHGPPRGGSSGDRKPRGGVALRRRAGRPATPPPARASGGS